MTERTRTFLIAAFAAALLALPLHASAAPASESALPVSATLDNGLRVSIVPDRIAPVVTTTITYEAGSDEASMPGQAHALEHMLFRGTKDVSATQFAEILARAGADYNAETTNRYTRYYLTMPSRYLDVALRLEADRMRGALLRQEDWARERGAIEQEVAGDEGSASFGFSEQLRHRLYSGTPYAESSLGTVPGFEKMTATDLRSFYDTWYHPNDAILVVAGDVDPQQTLAKIRALFDPIPRVELPSRPTVTPEALQTKAFDQSLDVAFSSAGFAYRIPGQQSSDYAATEVLIAALNNPRGPLQDFVYSGAVLGASASAGAFPELGVATVYAIVRPDADVRTTQDQLDAILNGYLRDGVSDDAVSSAKRRTLASRAFDLASIRGVAFAWTNARVDGFDDPDARIAAISAVTTADVDRVLRAYFAPDKRVSIAIQARAGENRKSQEEPKTEEKVAFEPTEREPLPAWAEAAFRNALTLPDTPSDKKSWILPNGIKLLVTRVRVAPVVVLRGQIQSNADLYAPTGKEGIDAITDALLNWGSATRDRKSFSAALDAIPASVHAGTSFSLSAQSADFNRALTLLADELLHPGLPAAGLQLIKDNYQREIVASEAQPGVKAEQERDAALYPAEDPALRRSSEDSIASITLSDVKSWYAKTFRPDLTSIVVVGDVDPDAVHALVMGAFGAWHSAGARPTFKYPAIPLNRAAMVTVSSRTTKQTSVELTELIDAYNNDPQRFALMLGDVMLANEGSASLLFNDLRNEKGYVYSVGSSLEINRQRSWYTFSFASDPQNADKATDALLADVRHLQTDLVSDDELQQAKSLLVSRSIMPTASYSGLASSTLEDLVESKDPSRIDARDDRDWKTLFAVTPEQVRQAMQKWVRLNDFVRVDLIPQAGGDATESSVK